MINIKYNFPSIDHKIPVQSLLTSCSRQNRQYSRMRAA